MPVIEPLITREELETRIQRKHTILKIAEDIVIEYKEYEPRLTVSTFSAYIEFGRGDLRPVRISDHRSTKWGYCEGFVHIILNSKKALNQFTYKEVLKTLHKELVPA